jgi:dihydrolipoamide dehydrogenase
MSKRITILGAGPGGYVAALYAAQLGAQVTVIENDNLGGTCLNWGCIPTKTMKSSAEAIRKAQNLSHYGIELLGDVRPDFNAIMKRKDKVVATLVGGIAKAFKAGKVQLLKGTGNIVDPYLVQVKDDKSQVHEVSGDKLILATGSRPHGLPNLQFNGTTILSSNDILNLEEIPKQIIILGGGVIGVEFAFIFKLLGSHVTVVEAMDRLIPLPNIDADMSKTLLREMKKSKISIHLNTTIQSVESAETGGIRATLGPSPFNTTPPKSAAKQQELEADTLFLTVGRAPNSDGIGVDRIGVVMDDKGWILANEKMETNIQDVYAIGDILGPTKIMLAHVASMEGLVAVENCLGANKAMEYRAVPSGIYTFPEVADVGLTQQEAEDAGIDYRADTFLFRELGMSQAKGELSGQIKMITERESGRVLGVHIIGEHATELIAEAVLAIQTGLSAQDLAQTIHAHPTLAEGLWETARIASMS